MIIDYEDIYDGVLDAEMIAANKFITDVLNNRISRIKNPVASKTLDLPKNRAVHINMLNSIDEVNFSSLNILDKMDRERLLVYNITKVNLPIGKVIIKKKDYSSLEMSMRRVFDKLKIVKEKDKVVLTNKDVMVFNYKLLFANYTYQQQKLRNYYILKNNLSTLVDMINSKGVFNYNNILLELPTTKVDIAKLTKWGKKSVSPAMDSDFPDMDSLLIFEFWKMFFGHTDSVFKKIDVDKLENTFLTFHSNGLYTTYRLLDILGMSKDSNVEGRIKALRPIDAAKMFLLSIYKFNQTAIIGVDISKGITDNTVDEDISVDDLDTLLDEIGINAKETDEDEDELDDIIDNDVNESDIPSTSALLNKKRLINTFVDVSKDTNEMLYTTMDDATKTGVLSKNENAKLSETLMEQNKKEFIIDGKKTTLGELLDYSNIDMTIRAIPMKDADTVIDKSMIANTNNTLTKDYLEKLYYKDLYNAIYSVQNGKVVITDHKVEYSNSFMGAVEKHTIQLKPINGKPSTITFPLPVIDKETGTYKMSATTYLLRLQRKDLPIRKTSPKDVLLTSYNGKLFIEKNRYQKNNPSDWFAKHITKEEKFSNIILKSYIPYDQDLPKAYTLISGGVSRFTYDGHKEFIFDFKNRYSIIDVSEQSRVSNIETKNKMVLIGRNKERTSLYFMNKKGLIVSESKGVFREKGDLEGYFHIDLKDIVVEVANIKVLGKLVPLGLILLQYVGLDGLIKILGRTPYRYYTYDDKYKLARNEYIIKIKNGVLVFDKNDTVAGLIFYGLPKDIMSSLALEDLNNKEALTTMFTLYGLSIAHVNNIIDMETLFLDNITKDTLRGMNEPDDMHRLLVRAIELLSDDNYKNPNNIHDNEIVGYVRIPGLVFKSLSRAVQSFNNRNTLSKSRITLDPYEIWRNIGDDSTSMPIENNNPIATIKQRDNVTYLGEFGRSKITMTIPSRIMTPDEVGIISEASPDSGDSGISTYLTHDANITTIRGMVKSIDMSKYTINKALSTANILNAFIVNDSPNRINFASIQASHLLPMVKMRSNRILTGAEAVIANKVGKPFVYTAEGNGVITKVKKDDKVEVEYNTPKEENIVLLLADTDDLVLIRRVYEVLVDKGYNVVTDTKIEKTKYKVYIGSNTLDKSFIKVKDIKSMMSDLKSIPTAETLKTKKSYSLRPWSSKVEGGSSIKHVMGTHFKAGDKVSIDEAITYDIGFFELNIFDPKSIIFKMGNYVKLAFIEDKYTYEDSMMISKKILKDAGEVVYKVVSKVIDTNSHIVNVLPEGTEVKYGMKLMSIIDSSIANNTSLSDRAKEIITDSSDRSPKAKSNGVIDRIDVIYNCDINDMDPTVRALADVSNKRFKEEHGTDGRVTNEYSINGKPLLSGEIELKYYISTIKEAIIGDKFIAIHQLKNTAGSIADKIETEDGVELDGIFGNRSQNNRIINSGYLIGSGNALFEYYNDLAIKAYRS